MNASIQALFHTFAWQTLFSFFILFFYYYFDHSHVTVFISFSQKYTVLERILGLWLKSNQFQT